MKGASINYVIALLQVSNYMIISYSPLTNSVKYYMPTFILNLFIQKMKLTQLKNVPSWYIGMDLIVLEA